ncbi:4-hydroxy-tetrahydrodipicolinate synthase [Eubacteriales bacterium OttesenSCG-928-N13]|nr:4-hydroxy-tetrahydrodipicolinate synthase [Eubacteriales bacterium OttesenSCG-928-N13]
MKPTLFTGSGVALATPFDADGIDKQRMRAQVQRQIDLGTDALIVLGTTGEPSTMTQEERDECISLCVGQVQGRVPVIAGAGANDTRVSIAYARRAQRLGADGLLVVTPYYNRPSQRGLIAHYTAIADATDLPLILYNVPSRTGTDMLPETVATLSQHPNIVALKEANGNLIQLSETINLTDGRFPIYSGNDEQVLTIMALGGKGVISVAANIIPDKMHQMATRFAEGDVAGARELQLRYMKLIRLLFIEPSPAPLKAAMQMLGLDSGRLRLPLVEVSLANQALIRSELHRLGLLSD